MTRTPKLAAAFLSFCVIAPAVNAAPFPPPENVAGGYAWNWRSKSLSASDQPRPLPRIPEEELTTDQRAIVDLAKKIPGNQHNLAIILVERGRILYENYKWPSNSRAPMMSWSMSKSLTAYTIGNMYCDGVIGNLAAPAMTYSKTLENLGVYGQAPVVDLMKMASGAAIPTGDTFSYDGGRYPGVWMDIAFSQSLSLEQYMKDHSAPYIAPGSQYSYSNTDTIALGYVAEDNGGFISNFEVDQFSETGSWER
jgi:CubicO group peptidase (beta-lactamase class C family)